MFIVAGISPRIKVLDEKPRICPACGLAQSYLKRADSYFSLFFIPLFRVKKGEPFYACNRCNHRTAQQEVPRLPSDEERSQRCRGCGRRMEREFRYCPFCGHRLA